MKPKYFLMFTPKPEFRLERIKRMNDVRLLVDWSQIASDESVSIYYSSQWLVKIISFRYTENKLLDKTWQWNEITCPRSLLLIGLLITSSSFFLHHHNTFFAKSLVRLSRFKSHKYVSTSVTLLDLYKLNYRSGFWDFEIFNKSNRNRVSWQFVE